MKVTMIMRSLLTILLVMSSVGLTACAVRPEKTGVYSNQWYSSETGDLGGYRLTVKKIKVGYVGSFVQCEGACSQPQEIRPVFKGNIITFNFIYADGSEDSFAGEIDSDGITITSTDYAIGKPPLRLLRQGDE